MITKITGKVFDSMIVLGSNEILQLGNLNIKNTEPFAIRLHLDYTGKDKDLEEPLTPQGAEFEQQWER